jgi:hypothetical protein
VPTIDFIWGTQLTAKQAGHVNKPYTTHAVETIESAGVLTRHLRVTKYSHSMWHFCHSVLS